MEPKKSKGRQRLPEIDREKYIALVNEIGNINRAAVLLQMDPAVVKLQLARHNLKIGRKFSIVKNTDAKVVKNIEVKVPDDETFVVGSNTYKIADLLDALNELGNISKASLKLGLVDSGLRSCLRNRGLELHIEYVLVPLDKAQPRNKSITDQ